MTLLTMKGGTLTFLSLPAAGQDYLRAARVSMGALHHHQVTPQCVPDYDVELKASGSVLLRLPIGTAIDQLNAANQRVRMWWFLPPLLGAEVFVTTMNNIPNGNDTAFPRR